MENWTNSEPHTLVGEPQAVPLALTKSPKRDNSRNDTPTTVLPNDGDIVLRTVVQYEGPERDGYVSIPSATPWDNLLYHALAQLGYPISCLLHAKGSILVKNWKPLSLECISEDNKDTTVGEILAHIYKVITLRIRLHRARRLPAESGVKERILQLLLPSCKQLLANAGCPIDNNILNALCCGTLPSGIFEETKRQFDIWWDRYMERPERISPVPHPAIQTVQSQYPTQKARMRTSFDPDLELPKLQAWFQHNPHPTRLQVLQYVRELNSQHSRRGRKPLDVNNVVYWFKNARAAHKRATLNGSKSPGLEDIEQNLSSDVERCEPKDLSVHDRGQEEEEDKADNDVRDSPGAESYQKNESCHSMSLSEEEPEKEEAYKKEKGIECEVGMSPPGFPLVNPQRLADGHPLDRIGFGLVGSPVPPPATSSPCPSWQSVLYMSQYMSGLNSMAGLASAHGAYSIAEERRKRNRTFIDPVTEVPRLEQWFAIQTHPSHSVILKYTEELNRMPYRQKFPKLEPKNVQFWFKNRRAKCKRLKMSLAYEDQKPSFKVDQPEFKVEQSLVYQEQKPCFKVDQASFKMESN